MRDKSLWDKLDFLLMPVMGLVALFIFFYGLAAVSPRNVERNEVATNNVPERNKLTGRTQEFSIRGYNFKTTTICLEGKEIMFIFHGAEHQIVNLNKDCEKENDANRI